MVPLKPLSVKVITVKEATVEFSIGNDDYIMSILGYSHGYEPKLMKKIWADVGDAESGPRLSYDFKNVPCVLEQSSHVYEIVGRIFDGKATEPEVAEIAEGGMNYAKFLESMASDEGQEPL